MPKYVFECETNGCLMRFERTLRMGDHPTHECPECHGQAPRVLEQEGFAFSFAKSSVSQTGNTGVHKDDYPTADQIVGRDAEAKWENYAGREKVKAQARAQGNTHALVGHIGPDYIEYAPMSNSALDARKKLFANAVERVSKSRSGR